MWNDGGTIKKLAISGLGKNRPDCSRSPESVCGVGDVRLYRQVKRGAWDGRR